MKRLSVDRNKVGISKTKSGKPIYYPKDFKRMGKLFKDWKKNGDFSAVKELIETYEIDKPFDLNSAAHEVLTYYKNVKQIEDEHEAEMKELGKLSEDGRRTKRGLDVINYTLDDFFNNVVVLVDFKEMLNHF